MANAPFSGSVLVLKENGDGIYAEVYHWDNLADGVPIPPRGSLTQTLAAEKPTELKYTFHKELMAETRTELITKFTAYVNAKFPDTAA